MPQRASVSPYDRKGLEMGASSGTKLWTRLAQSVIFTFSGLSGQRKEWERGPSIQVLSSTESSLEWDRLGNHPLLKTPEVSMGCRQAIFVQGPEMSTTPCC